MIKKTLEINKAWCKGCGICVAFCPKKVLEMQHGKIAVANPDSCILCNICGGLCPDYAIWIEESETEVWYE